VAALRSGPPRRKITIYGWSTSGLLTVFTSTIILVAVLSTAALDGRFFMLERQGQELAWAGARLAAHVGRSCRCGVLDAPITVAIAALAARRHLKSIDEVDLFVPAGYRPRHPAKRGRGIELSSVARRRGGASPARGRSRGGAAGHRVRGQSRSRPAGPRASSLRLSSASSASKRASSLESGDAWGQASPSHVLPK
jgi:hypothetical protein